MISLKNVEKYYNKGKENEIHVLNNVSFEFPKKGIVALFGKSASGKTTLLNAIGGLSEISNGEISIHSHNISKNTDNIRNRYIGYIFQNYCLNSHSTVYDNVADVLRMVGMNDEQEINNRVDVVLKCVGMEKFAFRVPDTLSGGQQQRVAIARALVKNPEIILADEPTGNLDEENTALIMELLKRISKNRLVVLVTHEMKLIEAYSDVVVEISDGSIVSIRNNLKNERFDVRGNNLIYLGELEKRELISEVGRIAYYGELSKEQLDIVIVNQQGKLYLKVNAPQIKVLGDYSEVILKEETIEENVIEPAIDVPEILEIEQLCEFEDKKLGKLFGWKTSIVSGWKSIAGGIGSNKLLRAFLFFFSVILVLMTAFYGTAIENVMNAHNANNANTFYAYVPNEEKAQELTESIGSSESEIDSVEFSKELILGDQDFYVELPRFESSLSQPDELSVMRFHATLFDETLSDGAGYVCGKIDEIKEKEAIITTAVADTIIENSRLSFINNYNSLLGFNVKTILGDDGFKIVGVVNSEEYAVYLNKKYFADKLYDECLSVFVTTGENYNLTVPKGNTILRINSKDEDQIPSIGDTIVINGNNVTISKVHIVEYSYEDWIRDNHIDKKSEKESEYSGFEYVDYYYKEFSEYVSYCKDNRDIVEYDAYKQLISDGCKEAWYVAVMELCGQNEYYVASCFKEDNGYYPSQMEMDEAIYEYDDPYIVVDELIKGRNLHYSSQYTYILNDDDYIDFSKGYGRSSGYGIQNDDDFGAYVVIHSTNPEVTESYLSNEFSGIITPNQTVNSYITPNMLYDMEMAQYKDELIASLAVWLIFMCIICLCVYMLMRGNVMNKVREIGIYRCIGVTRGNIVFRFFCESLVMIGVTAGMGHLITSVFLWILENSKYSYLIYGSIFYPLWIGVLLFILILGVSIISGLLPIITLLRKSPSEIISKYDI